MTELNIPDVTDDDRRLARKWAKTIAAANRAATPVYLGLDDEVA